MAELVREAERFLAGKSRAVQTTLVKEMEGGVEGARLRDAPRGCATASAP